NETNVHRFYGLDKPGYYKDGIQEYIVHGNGQAVNYGQGTKAAFNYDRMVPGGGSTTVRLRLSRICSGEPFQHFEEVFANRISETDEFYAEIQKDMPDEDQRRVQRQAFAGMLWNKQLYIYNVEAWLKGDPGQPPPPPQRLKGRNYDWFHLKNSNII